jgi:hypothetical protein
MGTCRRRSWAWCAACVLILGTGQAMAEDIVIAKAGPSDWTILVPAKPTEVEKRAAETLVNGVKALVGVTLAVNESGGGKPANVIEMVRGGDASQFAVKTAAGRVELSGNPLAAAYALLDRLGWNQVSLYAEQDWGLSVRPPKDRVLALPAGLEITSAKGIRERALIVVRPAEMLEPFLDWAVGHGANVILIPPTTEETARAQITRAAEARGLAVGPAPAEDVTPADHDRGLFAAPTSTLPDFQSDGWKHSASVRYWSGPAHWFWDAYADVEFITLQAAWSGATDVAALRRRYCDVAYGATAERALEYFALLDEIRTRVGKRKWAETVAADEALYDLWQRAVKIADRGRAASPDGSAQRKRWVWLLSGASYHSARVEALRALAAAKKLDDAQARADALRSALAALYAYNQGKVAALLEGERYGLRADGAYVGLERELPIAVQLRDVLLAATGTRCKMNLASGAKATVGISRDDAQPGAAVTDGDPGTVALLPADPLARVTVDLGAEKKVGSVRFINAATNLVTAYRVQVVTAEGATSTVAEGRVRSAAMYEWQSASFAPQMARYIVLRIDGFASLRPGGGAGVAEMEIE